MNTNHRNIRKLSVGFSYLFVYLKFFYFIKHLYIVLSYLLLFVHRGQYSSGSPQPAVEEDIFTNMAKNPIHLDAVVSLAPVQPGLCLSGSKDKVRRVHECYNSTPAGDL